MEIQRRIKGWERSDVRRERKENGRGVEIVMEGERKRGCKGERSKKRLERIKRIGKGRKMKEWRRDVMKRELRKYR